MNSQEGVQDFLGEYRLDVEDFGPITRASVDLRPLTVFIGPSNTGKSYLAILMYALHQCFGDGSITPYGPPTRRPAVLFYPMVESILKADEGSSAILDKFRNWLLIHGEDSSQPRLPIDFVSHGTSPSEQQGSETDSRPAFPKDVDSYIRSIFERATVFGRYAEREIGRCFGVDKVSPLVRRSSCQGRRENRPRGGVKMYHPGTAVQRKCLA